jgi:hypothetical protein
LKDCDLVAQRENLQLERSTAPKRGGKCGDERREYGSERQSNDERQLSLYQSDRILREAQVKALVEAGSPLKGVEYPTGHAAVDEVLRPHM